MAPVHNEVGDNATADTRDVEAMMADVLHPADVLHVIVGLHQTVRSLGAQLRQRDAEVADLRTQLAAALAAKPTRRRKAAVVPEPEGQVPIPTGTAAAVARARAVASANGKEHAGAAAH